jgi:RimJ/RimL family protein N-acetyltransferase
VQLRDLRLSDASALLGSLTGREVTRFISPPPTTIAGFERFIQWATSQRVAGEFACFAVVPTGGDEPVGIIQVRRLNGSFETAEWGFAIAPAFWGTGLFIEAARLVLAFCFRTIGVLRLEARAATVNGRGNGAMRKLGASRDAVLKCSFHRDGRYFDQFLWSILREDWEMSRA